MPYHTIWVVLVLGSILFLVIIPAWRQGAREGREDARRIRRERGEAEITDLRSWSDGDAETADPQSDEDCTCVLSCAEDPATRCSLSGQWHVHPDDGTGVFGPCPVHPDAPGDR